MKKNPIKKAGRVICICVLMIVVVSSSVGAAYAYYDRGTISVSPAQAAVTLDPGLSQTIGVGISPASDSHPVGCGDPECPQICGELECDDGNGNCKCGGPDYITWEASVAASSSNSSVASASYSGGSVTITGVSAGTATITITAQMHQFTEGAAYIQVTVNGKKPDGGNKDNKPPGGNTETPPNPDPDEKETDETETQKTEVTKPKAEPEAEAGVKTGKTAVPTAKLAPLRAGKAASEIADEPGSGSDPADVISGSGEDEKEDSGAPVPIIVAVAAAAIAAASIYIRRARTRKSGSND
jgi:hypothetical protein